MARIVSLIASATEIVCALGFEEQIVGRSHECDHPESVKRLPICTQPKFSNSLPHTSDGPTMGPRMRLRSASRGL